MTIPRSLVRIALGSVRCWRPDPVHDYPAQEPSMAYVIAEPCIDVMDRACVEECPVDCIYEGGRSLYIHPDECVDCGACEPVCPVEAIYYEDDLPEKWTIYTEDNARFFTEPLPGRDMPLGSPGGAARLGPVGVDTELVASQPMPGDVEPL
jgi:NAD-dependent dihydropyrimidine dehydrogenase PreA subunit